MTFAATYRLVAWTALGGLALGHALPLAPAFAQARLPTIAGAVSSPQEGPMEGVLVSVQQAGSPISVTVVTDAHGRFSLPPQKLSPGAYALRIRAVGYDLDGQHSVVVPSADAAHLQLRLRETEDLAAQLTNTEWLMSMPGSPEQKRVLIECMSCHTLERIVRSRFDAGAFAAVLRRMANYANNTTMARVQARVAEREVPDERVRKVAAYLSSVNLSAGPTWSYPLKTLPRPQGRATRVVITEYDLPRRTIAPHDVRTDRDGFVWYSNFVEPFLGRLDPRTGEHAEYAVPVLKPGFPTGSLAMEPDADGNWWLALMFQGGLARFDVRMRRFATFPVPSDMNGDATQQSMVMPARARVDGKVWTNEVSKQAILRLDLASGRYEMIAPFAEAGGGRTHSPYGLAADAGNNLFFMDFGDESIGRVDAKTGAVTLYPTPTPASRPRRTMLDDRGQLWFAEYAADKVAMFDIERETFKEWDVPTPHTYPYDVFRDRTGALWSAGMASDRVLRLDPATGGAVEYLLPRPTNIRRIYIDDATTPVTFWAGNNHGAAIVKLEPLD
jgi:virginiamycin B lyase